MSLHGEIVNILADANKAGTQDPRIAYLHGHRDARHAAAELALRADAEIERLRAALEMAYCKTVGADSPHGLAACDDFRDWLASLAPSPTALPETEKPEQAAPVVTVGKGWELLPEGATLQPGDGFWCPEVSAWVDFECRPDLFRSLNEYVHSGWMWRRRIAAPIGEQA